MSKDFAEKFYDRSDKPLGMVDRDLRRLRDLLKQNEGMGTNTYEGNEMNDLIDEYGFEAYWEARDTLLSR